MRLARWNKLDMDLDLYDASLMSYTLHKLYELVEGIIREVN